MGVVGTPGVVVVNDTANAVPVRNIAAPPEPFVLPIEVELPGAQQGYSFTHYEVPAGKRLTIEHVSFENEDPLTSTNNIRMRFYVLDENSTNSVYHPVDARVRAFGGGLIFAVNEAVLMHAAAGYKIGVQFQMEEGFPGGKILRGTMTGYLTDAP